MRNNPIPFIQDQIYSLTLIKHDKSTILQNILLLFLPIWLLLLFACSDNGPLCPSLMTSSDTVIFAVKYGDEPGFWILDAHSLKLINSCEFELSSHFTFAPDYSEWYLMLGSGPTRTLAAINPSSKQITRQVITDGWKLTYANYSDLLITYGEQETQFWRRNTFSLAKRDNIGYAVKAIAPSPTSPMIYLAFSRINEQQEGFGGLVSYDTESFSVINSFNVVEDTLQQAAMLPVDMITSLDGEYLFLTTFLGSLYPDIWKRRFFVIDLNTFEVIEQYSCGAMSYITLSPDGNYVYIPDPAGGIISHGIFPTNVILRYSVRNHSMEEFISGPGEIGLAGSELITGRILIASDNRTAFINLIGDPRTLEGEDVHILKLDLATKKSCGRFAPPRNNNGYFSNIVLDIRFGLNPVPEEIKQANNTKIEYKFETATVPSQNIRKPGHQLTDLR